MQRAVSFLRGREVWREVGERVRKGKRTVAAVAFFARGGAELCPLKAGDTLVVDMSLPTVRQGATDPRELKKLRKRGVRLFSRRNLHAKFVVTDGWLVAGSMNVSENSASWLDEAAVLTNAQGAVAAAKRTIERWCGEPVLDHQLEQAIREYRPPVFKAFRAPSGRHGKPRAFAPARLWIVAGLRWLDLPPEEERIADAATQKTSRRIRRRRGTSLVRTHYDRQTRLLRAIRPEDWAIEVVEGRVQAPARVAGVTSYRRSRGKRRWLLVLEERDVPDVSWAAFARAARRAAGLKLGRARTRSISDDGVVDALLACWSRVTGKPLPRYFER